jgi:uncharacterized protein (TIGR02246 family)
MRLILLLLGSCLIVTGALAQSKPEMQKMADDWAAAFNKGDAAKVASFYKSDATVFPPGADMIHGRQNIEQFWKKATEGLGDGRFEVTNVEALGSNAARTGVCLVQNQGRQSSGNPREICGGLAKGRRQVGNRVRYLESKQIDHAHSNRTPSTVVDSKQLTASCWRCEFVRQEA